MQKKATLEEKQVVIEIKKQLICFISYIKQESFSNYGHCADGWETKSPEMRIKNKNFKNIIPKTPERKTKQNESLLLRALLKQEENILT